jgi:hypothetical protein
MTGRKRRWPTPGPRWRKPYPNRFMRSHAVEGLFHLLRGAHRGCAGAHKIGWAPSRGAMPSWRAMLTRPTVFFCAVAATLCICAKCESGRTIANRRRRSRPARKRGPGGVTACRRLLSGRGHRRSTASPNDPSPVQFSLRSMMRRGSGFNSPFSTRFTMSVSAALATVGNPTSSPFRTTKPFRNSISVRRPLTIS